MTQIQLTAEGRRKCEAFLCKCQAQRKEILDAGKDTADNTVLPSIEDIEADILDFLDANGDYYNCWGITNNYDSDLLCLQINVDFVFSSR